MRHIKKIDTKIFWSLIISFVFSAVMFMVMNMEVLEDPWYIESSADGLFGDNNVSLAVLCSHPLLTGLIYLLSRTGLRIFWFNCILVISVIISNIINIYIFSQKYAPKKWVVKSLLFLAVIMSMISYMLIFTVVGTYVVITGMFLVSYGLEEKRKKYIVGGILWFVLGSSIRVDCIYFGLIYFGVYHISIILIELIKNFSVIKTVQKCKDRIIIGIIIGIVAGLMAASYTIYLSYNNADILNWNRARSSVTDYELPDYNKYEEEYLDIGISENDYRLLRTWNNYDPDFFTLDRYEKLEQLRLNVLNTNIKNNTFEYFMNGIKVVKTKMVYWICVALFIFAFINARLEQKILPFLLILIMHALIIFFNMKGRLTIHIQHSILISTLIFLEFELIRNSGKCCINWKVWLFVLTISLFYKNNYLEESLLEQYIIRLQKDDNLISAIQGKDYSYYTYNEKVTEKISTDTENLYYFLLSPMWLQNYPLPVKNPFITENIGFASNVGFLTAYFPEFPISKYTYKKYNISNPIKDLTNDNIKVVLRKEEIDILAEPIKRYLQEHYYKTCNYYIENEIEDCVIIKFTI